MNKLSWSALELYNQCPYKFKKFYIDGEREPSNIYALFGIAIHKLLEYAYTKGELEKSNCIKRWPDVFKEVSYRKEFKHLINKDKLLQFEKKGYKVIKNFYKISNKYNLLQCPSAIEVKLKADYLNYKMVGKIDLVSHFLSKKAIIDWKTGKYNEKSFKQLTLYAEMFEKKCKQKIDYLVLVHLKEPMLKYRAFDYKCRKETHSYLTKVIEELEGDKEFKPKVNEYCKYCTYKKDCRRLSNERTI